MRIVYLGSPADAVAPLEALVTAGHDVALVVTRPDRRRSRRGAEQPSAVKVAADAFGLEVSTPLTAGEIVDEVRGSGATLGVVVAFGQILPAALIESLPHGFVNLHFSLLPRWRGAAPVERAILAGDTETGVCVMRVEEGLDTGPVYARATVAIGPGDTAGALRGRLVELGSRLLVDVLAQIPELVPVPQAGEPSYAAKLTVDEFRLDPARPAGELERLVRAGNPKPGAWFVAGGRVKVWRSSVAAEGPPPGEVGAGAVLGTADGGLVLEEVQPAGRRPMTGTAWLAGRRGTVTVAGA